jgi:hypothetical protein
MTMNVASGIDVHPHVVSENFPAYLGGKVPAQWPDGAGARMSPPRDDRWQELPDGVRSLLDFHDPMPVPRLGDAGLEHAAIAQILHCNAERYLDLAQGPRS